MRLLHLFGDVREHLHVEIVTAESVVAQAVEDLVDIVVAEDDGYVEGAATQVEDDHDARELAHVAVGQGSGSRLVDDAQDLEARYFSGTLGGLSLGAVEV